jgi:hypothetical protein
MPIVISAAGDVPLAPDVLTVAGFPAFVAVTGVVVLLLPLSLLLLAFLMLLSFLLLMVSLLLLASLASLCHCC